MNYLSPLSGTHLPDRESSPPDYGDALDIRAEDEASRLEMSMSDTEWLECLADAIDEQCYAVNATPSGFHAHDIDIAAKKVRHERALRTLRNDVQNGNREAVGKFVIDALHGYLLGVAEERRT